MSFLVIKKVTMSAVALALVATTLTGLLKSQGALLFVGLVSVTLAIALSSFVTKLFIKMPSLLVLYLTVFASTAYSAFLGWEISIWQIIRSQIWTLIAIPLGLASYYYANSINNYGTIKKTVRFVEVWIISLSVLVAIDIITGIPIAPAMIRSDPDSEVRMYIVGTSIGLFFMPVFLYMKKYLASLLSIFLIGITGGKTSFVILFVYIAFSVFTIKGKAVKVVAILLLVVTLGFLSVYFHRFEGYLEHGDTWRHHQVTASYKEWSRSLRTMLFGIGMGVPYWNGFLDILKDINKLDSGIENSRFDIENGYLYLLARLGLVGSIIYLYLITFRWGRYNLLFIISFLVGWIGGSPSGGTYALSLTSFGMAAGVFSRLVSTDYAHIRIQAKTVAGQSRGILKQRSTG